jgi:hypothetical protein
MCRQYWYIYENWGVYIWERRVPGCRFFCRLFGYMTAGCFIRPLVAGVKEKPATMAVILVGYKSERVPLSPALSADNRSFYLFAR